MNSSGPHWIRHHILHPPLSDHYHRRSEYYSLEITTCIPFLNFLSSSGTFKMHLIMLDYSEQLWGLGFLTCEAPRSLGFYHIINISSTTGRKNLKEKGHNQVWCIPSDLESKCWNRYCIAYLLDYYAHTRLQNMDTWDIFLLSRPLGHSQEYLDHVHSPSCDL